MARRPALQAPRSALLAAVKQRTAEQGGGEQPLEQLARSKALAADVRAVEAACRQGGSGRIKVETVERLSRKVLGIDPHTIYGEQFGKAWQFKGKRVDARVAAFDHCFSSPKSVSLLAGGGGEHVGRQVAAARAEALEVALGFLQRHGVGVRREHNGTTATTSRVACSGSRSSIA